MITQSATCVIDCTTQAEYDAAKDKLASFTLPPNASVAYDPVLHRITITVPASEVRL